MPAHTLLNEHRGFRHPGHRVGLVPEQGLKILIQTKISECRERNMTVPVRIFFFFFLVVFLGCIKVFQRQELDSQFLPGFVSVLFKI